MITRYLFSMVLLIGLPGSPCRSPLLAQEEVVQAGPENDELVLVEGLVVDRQKYSFTLQGPDRNYQVVIPNGVPVLMKLTRPQIDLTTNELKMDLMLSAANGNPDDDLVLKYELPETVHVSAIFSNEQEKKKALQGQVKQLERFVLSATPPARGPLTFGGVLSASPRNDQFFADDEGSLHSVQLGQRKGLLGGFSILDLNPLATSVWVQGRMENETLIASRIRFSHFDNPLARFDLSRPTMLSLGDVGSYCYHQPLVEALGQRVNVYHPPVWSGPSRNWNRLHHHLGNLQSREPTWDVIAFSYGIRDQRETREQFQANLRHAIAQLQRTGSRLIWVSSTPIPGGYPKAASQPGDYAQGRMKLQNDWAAEVLANRPEIMICDLWQFVKNDTDEIYTAWWQGKNLGFSYDESIPLARRLARYVVAAAALSDQEINPPSVHSRRLLKSDPANVSK